MKICSFEINSNYPKTSRMGILDGHKIIDLNFALALHLQKQGYKNVFERANAKLSSSLYTNLTTQEDLLKKLQDTLGMAQSLLKSGDEKLSDGTPITFENEKSASLRKPLDKIGIYRDFFVHEKHVAKGFQKRNEPVPPAWYEIPVYYKGATAGFIGPNEEVLWPSYTDVLDYELELAIVIARDGKNIKASNATDYILGYTILNDISARDIQRKEMSARLGPSKGKDFCSIIGPVIVTQDEFGKNEPNLTMTAKINGEEWSRGQSGDGQYTFAQMMEFASKDEWLLAGDLIGSGTVGTGCGLELDKWIKAGDVLELEVEKIGILKNKVGNKQKA